MSRIGQSAHRSLTIGNEPHRPDQSVLLPGLRAKELRLSHAHTIERGGRAVGILWRAGICPGLARKQKTGNPFLANSMICFSSALVTRRASESSRTTHAAPEAIDCCRLFAEMISKALSGISRENLLSNVESTLNSPSVAAIAQGGFANKARSEIKGSGYCVESLEAALWCFYNTTSFRDAVLEAVNLGDDADTTAAITGQIAGAFYGIAQIPPEWLDRLAMRELIDDLARQLFARAVSGRTGS